MKLGDELPEPPGPVESLRHPIAAALARERSSGPTGAENRMREPQRGSVAEFVHQLKDLVRARTIPAIHSAKTRALKGQLRPFRARTKRRLGLLNPNKGDRAMGL